MNEQKIEAFFNRFKKQKQQDNLVYKDVFHFDLTRESAAYLLNLVLIGKKKATASAYQSYVIQHEDLPQIGELSIVTDFDGIPYCVIETKHITVLPFNQVTFELCKREGEDENLESWQQNHIHFFTEEGKKIGYTFDQTMLVVFEDFEVIYQEER